LGPIGHTLASVGLGALVWAATGSTLAIPTAVAAGALVDLDHIMDFFDSKDEGRNCHMFRPFHAWEYLPVMLALLAWAWPNELFLAVTLGYLSHLVIDQLTNRVHPLAYSIVFRASRGFRRRHLTPFLFDESYRMPKAPRPLWGRLEPSLWRLVTKLRGEEN
jgi:membrane-bound metal-dependent hydrolase YbcI (DUF457 family)